MSLEKQIKSLNKTDYKKVLAVISSHQIQDETAKISKDCGGYECCPCNTQIGDHCGCNAYCKCPNFGPDIKILEIYESIQRLDQTKINQLLTNLKKKISPKQIKKIDKKFRT